MVRFPALAIGLAVVSLPAAVSAQGKFFESKGVEIHYVEQGAGEPVILIHGNGGSVQTWVATGVSPDLANNYRVISMDCRGHGLSGKPHEAQQYGTEMAMDIVRLLDHLHIQRAHIIGHSMGANLI